MNYVQILNLKRTNNYATNRVVITVDGHGALENGRESLDLVGALSNVITEVITHGLVYFVTFKCL